MKRLLCIISGMNAGGAETFLMKVFRTIDRMEYQLDFAVNIEKEGFYDKEIYALGGKIYHFPAKSAFFWGYVKGLKKIIHDNHYDYVLRITSNAMGFLDLALAKKAGAKKCIARSSNSSDGASLKVKISHWLGSILFKRFVDVKIAPSSEAAIYTFGKRDYEKGLVNILPNGLDLKYFSYTEIGRESIRREFNIKDSQKVIGHVGRFSTQKNQSFLLHIFGEYHKKEPNSVLMLIGEGGLKTEIQRKVNEMMLDECVIFAGIRADMPSVYSAMDVFVFPSLYEGMPNAVIEAQACGLPCVIADSITKEANVSGVIEYESLKNNLGSWVEKISECVNKGRVDSSIAMKNAGYDIDDVVKKFGCLID